MQISFKRRYPRNRPVQLNSAALRSVVYHPKLNEMEVEFTSGSRYQYGCVEQATYRGLIDAESKGSFFVKQIRNDYPFRRLS